MPGASNEFLLGIGYKHVRGGEDSFERGSRQVRTSAKEAAKEVSFLDAATEHLSSRFVSFLQPARLVDAALALVAASVVTAALSIGTAIRISAEFEQGLVGVGKTADIQGAALRALGEDIDDLSRRIPVGTKELLEIGEAAGSLGVVGSQNILKFTETVAKLGRSSDLVGSDAAAALAQILNVTGESTGSVDALASVIVSLGNAFSATESQIARTTGEVARAIAVYDVSSSQAAAIATTLVSFGVRAELAGSATARAFRTIESAVKSGGEKMAGVAKIAGASADEVRAAWERGPVEAFNLFLQGVGRVQESGGNVAATLASVGLRGEEVLKVIPVLAKQYESLAKAQALAAKEAGDPTALNTEFARSATTLDSQLGLLRNTIDSLWRIIGDQLAPVVRETISDLLTWLDSSEGLAEEIGSGLADALRDVIDLVVFLVRHWQELRAILIGVIAVNVVQWLAGIGVKVLEQVASLRLWIATTINAQHSQAAFAAETARSMAQGVASYQVGSAAAAAYARSVAATVIVVNQASAAEAAHVGALRLHGLTIEQIATLYAIWIVTQGRAAQGLGLIAGAAGAANASLAALAGTTNALNITTARQVALMAAAQGNQRLLAASTALLAQSEQALVASTVASIPAIGGQTLALTGATAATVTLTTAQKLAALATAALSRVWTAFTATLAANPITAIALALGVLAAALFYAHGQSKEAREEAARYHEELRTGRYEIEGYAAEHDKTSRAIEEETQRLRELRDEQVQLVEQLQVLEGIAELMKRALDVGDRKAYRDAIADARALGVVINESAAATAYEQVTKQLEVMRAAMEANEAQAKLSADEITVAEQKMRESIGDSIEAERRRMLRAQANVAELEQKAAEAERALRSMVNPGWDGRDFVLFMDQMKRKVLELRDAAAEARQGIANIAKRLDDLRAVAKDQSDSYLNEGQYDRAADLLRKMGLSEDEIKDKIELAKIFNGIVIKTGEAQGEVNTELGAADKKAEALRKRFERLNSELEGQTKNLNSVAAAYGQSTAAGLRKEAQVDREARAAATAAEFEGKYRDAILARVKDQIDADRRAQGAKTTASLQDQITAAEELQRALASGVPGAAERAAEKQELLATQTQLTTGAMEDQAPEIERLAAKLQKLEKGNAFLTQKKQAESMVLSMRAVEDEWKDVAGDYEAATERVEAFTAAQEVEQRVTQETTGYYGDQRNELASLIRERERMEALFEARMRLGRLEAEVRRTRELTLVKREDFRTEREYQKALRETNTQHQLRSALLSLEFNRRQALAAVKREDFESEDKYLAKRQSVIDQFAQMEERTRAAILAQADLNEILRRNEEQSQTLAGKWLTFASGLRGAMVGVSDEFQNVATGLAMVIEGFVKAAEAGDHFAGKLQGLAGVAQGLYAIADAAGLLDQNVTAGGFGGRGEGNYSQEGSQVGAVIGAIIGAYLGNAQAGMAIGSAAGGILGSFIKKGAEEALGRLVIDEGRIQAAIDKNEGRLGEVVDSFGSRVNDALRQIMDQLGADLLKLPNISLKVRDGLISVVVGAVRRRFSDMDEAIAFTITEILKQGEFEGMSETIRTVLENTIATDLDQLGRDLDFGRWYERLGLADGAIMVLDRMQDFRIAFRRAIELGLDPKPIFENLGRELQLARNSILGIEEDPAERIRRNAEAFNQQVLLLRAQQTTERAKMLLEKAKIEAEIASLRAEGDIAQIRIGIRRSMLDAETGILDAEFVILQQALLQLDAINDALAALDASLALIGDDLLISQEEIDAAIRRARRGSGGGARQQREEDRQSFEDELDDIVRGSLPEGVRAMAELGLRLAEMDARAQELGASEEKLRAARQALIDQAKDQILEPVRPFLDPQDGGTFGLSQWESEAGAIRNTFDEARAANRKLLEETGQRAIAFWKLNQAELRALNALAERAVDSLNLPMEQARDRVQGLQETIGFLRESADSGAISAGRFADVMGQLQKQSEGELLGMAQGILDQMGQTEEAARLKAALEEANFDLQVAQLNFLYEQYLSLGLISDSVKVKLDAALGIINDPKNRPTFDWQDYMPQSGRGEIVSGNLSSGNGAKSQGQSDDERRRKEILDQIKEWGGLGKSDLTRGLRDLHDRLAEISADAQRLGIDAATMQASYQNAVANFWDDALSRFEEVAPETAAERLAEIHSQFDELIAAAHEFGGDVARIEAARQAEIRKFWDEALEPIRSLQDQLAGSQFSGKSPEQQLQGAQAKFNEIAQAALSGDLSAMQELPDAVNALLEQAQSYYGLGPAYQALLQQVQGVVAQILALGPQGVGQAAQQPTPAGTLASSPAATSATAGAALVGLPDTWTAAVVHVDRLDVGELALPLLALPTESRRPAELPAFALVPGADDEEGGQAAGSSGRRLLPQLEEILDRRDQADRAETARLRRQVEVLAGEVAEQKDELARLNKLLDRLLPLLEAQARKAAG